MDLGEVGEVFDGVCPEEELPVDDPGEVVSDLLGVGVDVSLAFEPHLVDAFERGKCVLVDECWL